MYIALLAILCIASFAFAYLRSENHSTFMPEITNTPHVAVPYNVSLFQAAVAEYPVSTTSTSQPVIAGVGPHHDIASPLIAQLYARIASSRQVRRVILIGPNHPDSGPYHVGTATITWQVAGGTVHTDAAVVNSLVNAHVAYREEDILAREHSIYTHLPFIHHYFPSATVVPIIFHSQTTLAEAESLARTLQSLDDDHTVVIASVDFSHYLPDAAALAKDVETKRAMDTYDFASIAPMQSDHLDSPKSIITLLSFVRLYSDTEETMLGHTTAASYLHHPVESSTSYYTIVWSKRVGTK